MWNGITPALIDLNDSDFYNDLMEANSWHMVALKTRPYGDVIHFVLYMNYMAKELGMDGYYITFSSGELEDCLNVVLQCFKLGDVDIERFMYYPEEIEGFFKE